ncbi:MAG: hypothetical protein P4L51_04530 [Puia sp.]|nr:hypothetical protein [Puia sp.]
MSKRRRAAVQKAYATFGKDPVPLAEIRCGFNPGKHPVVVAGRRDEDEVLLEFFDTFEQHHASVFYFPIEDDRGTVSSEEFLEYHRFVSQYFEHDEEFCRMMEAVWGHIDPVEEEGKKSPQHYLGEALHSYRRGRANVSSPENTLYSDKRRTKGSSSNARGTAAVSPVRNALAQRGIRSLLRIVAELKVPPLRCKTG